MSLKPQSAKKIIKALSKLGFKIARTHGSHVVLKHADGRLTVVPVHPRKNIEQGCFIKLSKTRDYQKRNLSKY